MKIGQKYLINTDAWFFAPDGENYKSVFGTVHAVVDSEAALGVRTNARSTNWYVVVGDMIVAGCQVHYAVRADSVNFTPSSNIELEYQGERRLAKAPLTRIYNADASGLVPFGGGSD